MNKLQNMLILYLAALLCVAQPTLAQAEQPIQQTLITNANIQAFALLYGRSGQNGDSRLGYVADGVPKVQKAAHEVLRTGSRQIKVMAGADYRVTTIPSIPRNTPWKKCEQT